MAISAKLVQNNSLTATPTGLNDAVKEHQTRVRLYPMTIMTVHF